MSHHASGPNFGFPRGDARLDMTDLYAFPKPDDLAKSIIVFNVHPSFALQSPEPTTKEPFAPGALYDVKIDTNGDVVADICYSIQFASSENGKQTATVRRLQGVRAAGLGEEGEVIVQQAPVSVGREALVTQASDYRFFFGWRSLRVSQVVTVIDAGRIVNPLTARNQIQGGAVMVRTHFL